MRKLLVLLLIVACFSAAAAPIKSRTRNGKWTEASSWNLNRTPLAGDTVVILATDTIVVDKNISLNNIFVQIQGALFFNGGGAKLVLDSRSKVEVEKYGVIYSDKNSSQIIKIGSLEQYSGNGQRIEGPVYATGTTSGFIATPAPVPAPAAPLPAPIPLPVKFLGFSAVRNSANVLVQWLTAQEVNADYYQIERSEDGTNWNLIGKVNAAGNTSSTTNYSYTDKVASIKTLYYRIKQVDLDGRFEYTAVRTVKADATGNMINATTASGNIVLQFSKQVPGQVEVRLISVSGNVICRQTMNRPVGQVIIPANVKGHFILSVSNDQDIQVNKQILL